MDEDTETKAVTKLAGESSAQVMNYLAATGLKLGFLVNCGNHKDRPLSCR
ncbi:MAG: hypothetical protein Ta2A_16460 [Treponemataceae bacterium]|nr:MAG: hypothetical protein Ta2A_16460 [Treponemataceae bacterium]